MLVVEELDSKFSAGVLILKIHSFSCKKLFPIGKIEKALVRERYPKSKKSAQKRKRKRQKQENHSVHNDRKVQHLHTFSHL